MKKELKDFLEKEQFELVDDSYGISGEMLFKKYLDNELIIYLKAKPDCSYLQFELFDFENDDELYFYFSDNFKNFEDYYYYSKPSLRKIDFEINFKGLSISFKKYVTYEYDLEDLIEDLHQVILTDRKTLENLINFTLKTVPHKLTKTEVMK